MFGGAHAVFLDVRDEVVDLVGQEGGDAEDAGDADGDEGQAGFASVEAVNGRVDEREGFEEGVVDAVGESGLWSLIVVSRVVMWNGWGGGVGLRRRW